MQELNKTFGETVNLRINYNSETMDHIVKIHKKIYRNKGWNGFFYEASGRGSR